MAKGLVLAKLRFFQVLKQELRAIFTNSTILLIILGGSIIYALLYPTPYRSDVIDAQSVAIVDEDDSMLSKELIFYIKAMPQLKLLLTTKEEKNALNLLEKGEILGYVKIPHEFSKNLLLGITTPLEYIANASYFSAYGAIIEGFNTATSALSEHIKLERKLKSPTPLKEPELLQKEGIPLFNPTLGYMNYALAAVLIFILHQTGIGGIMILCAKENEANLKFKDPHAYHNNTHPFILISARLLIFSSIYIALFALFFGFFFEKYHISTTADIANFWIISLSLIFSFLSLGLFLGTLIKNATLPMQIVLASSLPIVFLLGFIWPRDLIPAFLDIPAHLIPAYHGINALLRLNQMDASLRDVMGYFYWLLFLGILYSSLALYLKSKEQS